MRLLRRSSRQRWLKSLPKRVSSAAMILENSIGQVVIVKSDYKPYWTFPGGIIDPHETPREAAIRETREEIGITVDPSHVEFVAVVSRSSSYAETYQFIFKAQVSRGGLDGIVLQKSEIDEYQLVTRKQVESGNRPYGKVIVHWAKGHSGYMEQTFGENNDA